MRRRIPFFIEYRRQHGYTPLDRIEQLCKEHALYSYDEVLDYLSDHDSEEGLFGWVVARRGISSRTCGIEARIAKAKRAAKQA